MCAACGLEKEIPAEIRLPQPPDQCCQATAGQYRQPGKGKPSISPDLFLLPEPVL
jgi:hypothetical protein